MFSNRLNLRHAISIHRMFLLAFLILVVLLTACTGGDDADGEKDDGSVSATPDTVQIRVSVAQAPVFSAPSSDSEVIINLFEGDLRRALGKSEPDRVGLIYYQVDLGNRFGWVAETQVEIQGDAASLALIDATATIPPAATLANSTPVPDTSGTPMVKVNRARAIVLATPNRTAEEIATIFEDEEFVALARTEADNLGDSYYLIQIGETQGWVLASQIEFVGDETQLIVANVVTATPTTENDNSTTVPTAIPTNTSAAATLVPSETPTFTPLPIETQQATLAPSTSPQATPTYSEEFEIQAGPEPPLTINLPEGWEAGHYLVPVANLFAAGNIAMSVYEGPLADGKTGQVWILWGFPNIADPFGGVNLWSDGLQLLRGLLFFECNIGIDTKREFTIDGQTAVGTYYSAVDCAQGADIAGWFGALQYEGGNFAIFTGVEPVERVTEGLPEIQTIVDSIKFEALE